MAMVKIRFKIPDWLDRICAWPVLEYRKRKYGYPFRRIPLTDGKYTIVDPPDYYRFNSLDWCARQSHSGVFYAVKFNNTGVGPEIIALHRLIMGSPVGMLVDHSSGAGLDNRMANLRLATRAQNCCNKKKRKNTSSKYMGVYFAGYSGKWRAKIKHNKKTFYLGYFDNEIDAAKAYDEAAKKYHTVFARLNFPEEAHVS